MKYSNCFIEALKAKIKNPRNVKIHLYPTELNGGELHFYWTDGVNFYHFVKENKNAIFLFKGKIKVYEKNLFYDFMGHKMFVKNLTREDAMKLVKKYHLPLTRDDIESIYFNEEND